MSGSQTNEVDTFSSDGCVAVRCAAPSTGRRVRTVLGERLGLREESVQLFGLFRGPLGAPLSFVSDDIIVSPDDKLCLQRWNTNLDLEAKLTRKDETATHLLFLETQFYFEQGRLRATAEQRQELSSLADPSFPAERQYLELARTIPGYDSYCVSGAVVCGDIASNEVQLPDGMLVVCEVAMERLELRASDTAQCLMEWEWSLVKRWRTPEHNQIHFQVCLPSHNAGVMTWIHLETAHSYFLRSAAEKVCHHLRDEIVREREGPPPPNRKMAGRPFDPLVDYLNSELFKVRLSSLEKH